MIDGSYDVEFKFAVRRGLEDAGIDFYLFDTGTIKFFKGGNDPGFFAGTGRAIDKQMGEIATLCLRKVVNEVWQLSGLD